jgi:hypothetical protein
VLKDPVQPTYLDAGPSLSLSGPGGTKTVAVTSTQTAPTGYYYGTLATAPSVYITPGSYTVSGSGGAGVGAFNWD